MSTLSLTVHAPGGKGFLDFGDHLAFWYMPVLCAAEEQYLQKQHTVR